MKYLLLLFYTISSSCIVISQENEDFKLEIHSVEKAENLITKYQITNEKLIVKTDGYVWLGKIEKPKENIVFEYKFSIEEKSFIKKEISKIKFDESFDEIYLNECIVDGLQLFMSLKIENKVHSSTIYNFYESRVDRLIQIVNAFNPQDYQIRYKKDELLQLMKDCE